MSFRLIITEAADLDTIVAYDYYEHQQAQLGERFLEELLVRYNDASISPHYYSYLEGDPKQVLRAVKLKSFPYLVVFEIRGSEVIIFAVHNTHMHPDKRIRR